MDTLGCIQLARQWLNENASARLCLSDAIKNYDDGDFKAARIWAKKSLFHSVGIFHADYKRVETFSRKMGD